MKISTALHAFVALSISTQAAAKDACEEKGLSVVNCYNHNSPIPDEGMRRGLACMNCVIDNLAGSETIENPPPFPCDHLATRSSAVVIDKCERQCNRSCEGDVTNLVECLIGSCVSTDKLEL
jgi:hypothetical protein